MWWPLEARKGGEAPCCPGPLEETNPAHALMWALGDPFRLLTLRSARDCLCVVEAAKFWVLFYR